MRTTQYSLVLVIQVVWLAAMFTFGAKVIGLTPDVVGATPTTEIGQAPAGSGTDGGTGGLLDHLTR